MKDIKNNEETTDLKFNFIFLGDPKVGKTSIIQRYTDDTFKEESQSTLGIDFKSKIIPYSKNNKILIKNWDLSGHERFSELSRSFYKNAQGAFIVVDVTKEDGLKHINNWLDGIKQETSFKQIQIILLANKIDEGKREIDTELLNECADKLKLKLFEVSAKTGEGVQEAFNFMVQSTVEKLNILSLDGRLLNFSTSFELVKNKNKKKNKSKCCS